MLKAKFLVPMIALAVVATGATLWSTGVVKAQANGNGNNMAQQLADKLGIDQSKVTGAMDQIQQEKQTEMKTQMETKLTEAIKAGTITEAQKSAILAKQTEMQQKREQERKDQQQWLSDNNLSEGTLQGLGLGLGLGFGDGMKGHGPF